MWRVITKTSFIKQRNGKDPDIKVTRTVRFPANVDIKIPNGKEKKTKDYGVTREQFHNILGKAAQPKKKSK